MKKQDNEQFSSTIPITNNFYSNEDWRFEQPVWDNLAKSWRFDFKVVDVE